MNFAASGEGESRWEMLRQDENGSAARSQICGAEIGADGASSPKGRVSANLLMQRDLKMVGDTGLETVFAACSEQDALGQPTSITGRNEAQVKLFQWVIV